MIRVKRGKWAFKLKAECTWPLLDDVTIELDAECEDGRHYHQEMSMSSDMARALSVELEKAADKADAEMWEYDKYINGMKMFGPTGNVTAQDLMYSILGPQRPKEKRLDVEQPDINADQKRAQDAIFDDPFSDIKEGEE